nr:hypothetical protein [Nitrosomonas nitrosa]
MSGQDDGGEGGSAGTIVGLIAAAVVVALGIWLVNEMADSARYSDCASSRRRNCDSIDYRRPPPPQQ